MTAAEIIAEVGTLAGSFEGVVIAVVSVFVGFGVARFAIRGLTGWRV